jgi:hypothetical protein
MAQTLYATYGNTAEWEIPIVDQDGAVIDLTGATQLKFMVKARIDDIDAAALIDTVPSVTNAPLGLVEVRLTPTDTAIAAGRWYVWGLQYKDASSRLWEFPEPSEDPGAIFIRYGVVAETP